MVVMVMHLVAVKQNLKPGNQWLKGGNGGKGHIRVKRWCQGFNRQDQLSHADRAKGTEEDADGKELEQKMTEILSLTYCKNR